jgi:hypothetical protein
VVRIWQPISFQLVSVVTMKREAFIGKLGFKAPLIIVKSELRKSSNG